MTEQKTTDKKNLPKKAKVVIIGGGVIGCSTAYHLAKLGWKDIVLYERAQLTSGTTWHAAGLIEANGFFSATDLDMAQYTLDLFSKLEEETGMATGYKGVGMITLASTPDRLEELRRIAAFNRLFGVDVEELTPQQVKEKWPLAEIGDVLAGFYAPGDGRVNPVDVTMALAKGARNGGVKIYENTAVTGFKKDGHRITGVITDKGETAVEYVVNCAGMWANKVGELAGVNVPLQPTEHYYLITESIEGVDSKLPVLVDFDKYA